jgi:hypothetical protein
MSFPQNSPRNVESGEVSPENQPGSVAASLAAPPPPAPSTSDSSPEQTPEDSTDWFRAAFQNMRAQQYGAAPGPSPEAPPASVSPPPESKVDGAQTSPVPESTSPGTGERQVAKPPKRQSEPAPSSEDFSRAVQSEVDRRLDKFNREEAARRQREQETKQREQERYLRDTDPHEFARLVREREQEQATTQQKLQEIQQFATEQITTYDRHVLDPLIKALPDSDQREILSHVDPGLEGRGRVTSAALAVLKKVYTDQGRQSARQALMNDQVFIKEILTRDTAAVSLSLSPRRASRPRHRMTGT